MSGAGTAGGGPGGGELVLVRCQEGYRDHARRYRVLLDGERVGLIGPNAVLRLPVAPGRHALRLGISWASSRALSFDCPPGRVVSFCCSAQGDPAAVRAGVTVQPGEYLALWRTPEPVVPAPAGPPPARMRVRLAVGKVFLGAGAVMVLSMLWVMSGVAPVPAQVVMGGSLLVTLAAMVTAKALARRP